MLESELKASLPALLPTHLLFSSPVISGVLSRVLWRFMRGQAEVQNCALALFSPVKGQDSYS